MSSDTANLKSGFFRAVIRRPRLIVSLMLLAIFVAAIPLASLRMDTSADAFLDANNPVLLYRDVVSEHFGLSDPFYIAVLDLDNKDIFNPSTLTFIAELSERVANLKNVKSSGVVSLATEKNMTGSDEGLTVEPFLKSFPITEGQAKIIRNQVADFPLYRDSLVGKSGQATLIVAELINESLSEETYKQLLKVVELLELPPGVQVHVAGEGAIAGYLGTYTHSDAKRLNPLAMGIVLVVIMLAFRRFAPALFAVVIVIASIVISLGLMSFFDIPFYVITNSMTVILVGISVADTIHVFEHFYQLQGEDNESAIEDIVSRTMDDMWRPITATSITTAAGFLGLYFASDMPPFKYFGLFTAVGVLAAWLYSILFLPAAIILSKPSPRHYLDNASSEKRLDLFASLMLLLGRFTLKNRRKVVVLFLMAAVAGAYSATQLVVDGNRIDLFDKEEPIYIADQVINKYLYGSNVLDIVIESRESEGLLEPHNLRKIEALQAYLESLPHVTGSISIVDYLKQMNRSLKGGETSAYALPESKELAAQYFLLYSMTADPSDFEEQIDYNYKMANIRVTIDSGRYRDFSPIVKAIQTYIDDVFNTDQIKATQSGRVNLNYHWMKNVTDGHFLGLIIALGLVYLAASLIYRSLIAGLYSLIPVISAVLCVYSFMVASGLTLQIGTSMFAAVSIGLGVDFAIHTIDRIKALATRNLANPESSFESFYTSTGRALLFNALAISCGFGVLIFSKVSELSEFGGVVVLSILASFVSSMTLVPALLALVKPKFVTPPRADGLTP